MKESNFLYILLCFAGHGFLDNFPVGKKYVKKYSNLNKIEKLINRKNHVHITNTK